MSEKISLVGLNKAAVLAALYNASKPQGMGFMHYNPAPMTVEQAQEILDQSPDKYFDYLAGRVMKTNLSGDELDTWGYDRDNGEGAAAAAIQELQMTGDTNSPAIEATHHVNTIASAEDVTQHLGDTARTENYNGMPVVHLGLDDVAPILGPAVEKAMRQRRA
jgi:hypothetical protein